jgi:hypothetical protein
MEASDVILVVLVIACICGFVFILRGNRIAHAREATIRTKLRKSTLESSVADLLGISEGDWKLLGEFAELVESFEKQSLQRLVYSDSLLLRPKRDIEAAFERALARVKSGELRIVLENNRAVLACFVATESVPKDLQGDIEHIERVWADDPGGKRLIIGAISKALARKRDQ